MTEDRKWSLLRKLITAGEDGWTPYTINSLMVTIEEMVMPQPQPSIEDIHILMSAIADGRRIDAIEAHSTLTGYGLKESKDAVMAICDRMNY